MILLLIAVTSLYVAAEFAIVGARRTRVSELATDGDRVAQRLLPIMEDHQQLDRYIAACQVGITLSSIILGLYALLVLDGASWHRSPKLVIPDNLKLVFLPPYTPELNPAEHLVLDRTAPS